MRLEKEFIQAFEKYTKPKLTSWLIEALLKRVTNSSEDGFYPHSSLNLFNNPIEGIEQLYSASSRKTQNSLRFAISKLAIPCRPNSPEFSYLTPDERISLMKEFLRLSEYVLCFEAIEYITAIALEDVQYWEKEGYAQEVFSSCLKCIGYISIRHLDSFFWNKNYISSIESSLTRFIGSSYFQQKFAPFTMHALVSTSPKHLFAHFSMLSTYISELHETDSTQMEHAHLTAVKILDKATPELINHFNELSFYSPSSRDRWFIDALFCPDSPLQFVRSVDMTNPIITITNQPKVSIPLRHDDWLYFSHSSNETPDASDVSPENEDKLKAQMQNFFKASAVTDNPTCH